MLTLVRCECNCLLHCVSLPSELSPCATEKLIRDFFFNFAHRLSLAFSRISEEEWKAKHHKLIWLKLEIHNPGVLGLKLRTVLCFPYVNRLTQFKRAVNSVRHVKSTESCKTTVLSRNLPSSIVQY